MNPYLFTNLESAMVAIRYLVIGLFAIQIHGRLTAQDSLPRVGEVIDRYVQVCGGRAKFKKIKTAHVVSTAQVGGPDGIKVRSEVFLKLPHQYLQKVYLSGELYTVRGSDGTTKWKKSETDKYEIQKNETVDHPIPFVTMIHRTNPERFYRSGKVVGKATVNGDESYHLEFVTKDGSKKKEYFSIKTGLLVKSSFVAGESKTLNVHLPVDYLETDYGIKFPKTTKVAKPFEGEYKTVSVQINGKVDSELFVLPDEVKALLEKQQ